MAGSEIVLDLAEEGSIAGAVDRWHRSANNPSRHANA
jgi:hypothetical protein